MRSAPQIAGVASPDNGPHLGGRFTKYLPLDVYFAS